MKGAWSGLKCCIRHVIEPSAERGLKPEIRPASAACWSEAELVSDAKVSGSATSALVQTSEADLKHFSFASAQWSPELKTLQHLAGMVAEVDFRPSSVLYTCAEVCLKQAEGGPKGASRAP